MLTDEILDYLDTTYHPTAIALYGSFADGGLDDSSDFDAVLVVKEKPFAYDGGFFGTTPLDVYLYTEEEIRKPETFSLFIQLYGAKIIRDTPDGLLSALVKSVREYTDKRRYTDEAVKRQMAGWLHKMLSRSKREDSEGYYRRHWLLVDSLRLYNCLRDTYYFGPKKALYALGREHPDDHALYEKALKTMDVEPLQEWIDCVCRPVIQAMKEQEEE